MSGIIEQTAQQKKLTSRQIGIVEILAHSAPRSVTVGVIAEKLGVSARTVLRELPDIENWTKENGFSFVRKPSVGLSIQESPERVQLLQKLLVVKPVHMSYTRRERRSKILGELFSYNEPIKSFVFLSRYQISSGTLSTDLNAIEKWLSDYQIRLVRRQGAGIWLEGTEASFRQAIANAAFEFMGAEELARALRGKDQPDHDRLSGDEGVGILVHSEIAIFVERVLRDIERDFGIHYAGSGYMALVVHLSVAIGRMQDGRQIEIDSSELEALYSLPEYSIAKQIAWRTEKKYGIKVSAEEKGFMAMHLSSARMGTGGDQKRRTVTQELDAHFVTQRVMKDVEQKMGLSFENCTDMQKDLERHISAMLHRLVMNIRIENSQEELVRQDYPEIYRIVKQSCADCLAQMGDYEISDAEAAYIAMYFAAVSELLQSEQERVVVAVVCPNGMGASRMLAASLKKHFPNMEIRESISAFEIDLEQLQEDGVELIITTIPLDIGYPMVCVPPIFQEKDVDIVKKAVQDLPTGSQRTSRDAWEVDEPEKVLSLGQIASHARTGREILQLLEYFQIRQLTRVRGVAELLGYAAGMFAGSMQEREIICAEFASRESIRTTFLPEIGIYLLHCRTNAVRHCRFGYICLEQRLPIPVGMVQGAVVMLAPRENAAECVEVISCLSVLLVEDENFLRALKQGNVEKSRDLIRETLIRFYKEKVSGDGE